MNQEKRIPIFKLYGGQEEWPTPDLVHCETIASRSTLHNWHIRAHKHIGLYQILYLSQGHAIVQLDEKQCPLSAGQIIEIPQAFTHGFRFDHDCTGFVMTIAYPLLTQLSHNLDDRSGLPVLPQIHHIRQQDDQDLLHRAFTCLNTEYTSQVDYRNVQIEALLTLIFVWLRRNQPRNRPTTPRTRSHMHFERFSGLIETHHTSRHDVAYYAAELGLSPAHLNVVTRGHSGKSPLELIHERLLLEARRSLVYTTMTISEISYELGFSDPAYFTRFFKKMTSLSPKAFRQHAGTLVTPFISGI
ncbi:helix-turn-helix domain-containing protein [Alcaligenaceae bacterium CGII-47]|nr:helix-turn-helix domain-containing protein [Alcaligenaceae bacterium CGII-47]